MKNKWECYLLKFKNKNWSKYKKKNCPTLFYALKIECIKIHFLCCSSVERIFKMNYKICRYFDFQLFTYYKSWMEHNATFNVKNSEAKNWLWYWSSIDRMGGGWGRWQFEEQLFLSFCVNISWSWTFISWIFMSWMLKTCIQGSGFVICLSCKMVLWSVLCHKVDVCKI